MTCVLLRAKPESDTVSVDTDGSGGDGGGDTEESETKEELNQELKPPRLHLPPRPQRQPCHRRSYENLNQKGVANQY